MKQLKQLLLCLGLITLMANTMVSAQSLQHPHIWVSNSDKQEIIDNINSHDWAMSLYTQLKTRVDAKKDSHINNPSAILNTIPAIPGVDEDRTPHNNMLTSAAESAILYFLSDDVDYAQYAADILSHYTVSLSVLDSSRYSNGTGIFHDDWWLESRALFPKIAMIYDLIYNYVNNPSNTVFDLASSSRKTFDNSVAQTTVKKLSAIVLNSIAAPNSNHSVLAGNGALFNLLMIGDDATREGFFNRFYKEPNGERFDAYQWTLDEFTVQDIWNETFGYSKGSHELVIQSLNVIDRYKPELDIINNHIRILDGFPVYENWFYPSGALLRFGDTGTEGDLLKGYQWILKIAARKNMSEYIINTKQALKFKYDERGGYNPEIETDRLGWWSPLQLLWGVNIEDSVSATPPKIESTIPVTHAGLIIQRNFYAADIENDGLMYYSGGASYVHTHSTGIDLELYGKGHVLGAESGSGSYGTDEHENYRVRHAAHNTIIANGSGKRGSNWATKMDKVELVSCEPGDSEEPISTKFSFSTQTIDDTYNNCIQQRTNSIIRTSPVTGYYFDIFRSKGKYSDNYHDYIYHNIGDEVSLKLADNTAVPLSASTKYSADGSGSVTGWKFFESVKSSNETNEAIKATFSLQSANKYMNVSIPPGIDREYATALAPKTKGALGSYADKKTPVMTMRKNGEAWDMPFIAIFEPSGDAAGTVQSVKNIEVDGKVIGAEVNSLVDGTEIKDLIISLDTEDSVYIAEHFISFKGRFGIVRRESLTEETETVTLYIGSGESLGYADLELLADEDMKNVETFQGVPKITPETRFTVNTQVLGGGGAISKSPDQADYPAGSQVVVTAVPEYGYVFDQWLGDAGSMYSSDTLTLFSNKNVLVKFRFAEYYTLNIASENGEVTQSEAGTEFPEQSCIELTAVADEGYEFDNWSGDVSSSENPLNICFDANKTITANFTALTSTFEAFDDSVIVKPNPSNGRFRVQVGKPNSYSVFDTTGKIILNGQAEDSFELDLTSHQKTLYILNIETIDGVSVVRIIND